MSRTFLANAVRGGAVAAVFLLILFAAAELALRAMEWGNLATERGYPRKYFNRDPNGISVARPGRWRVVTKSSATGNVIYDVHYTIDEYGKRVTPVREPEKRAEFLMLFGCSFTVGEGVQDDETIAYYAGGRAPNTMPYNFAFHGGGPFDALARLETLDFAAQVPQRRGVGVYIFIDDHVNRVNDSSSIAWWHGTSLYYDLEADGHLVRNGSFRTARPVRSFVYRAVYESRVVRRLGVKLPLKRRPAHFDLTATVLDAVDQRFRERFPGSDFYVVFYPGSHDAPLIMRRLDRLGVRYLDYRTLFTRGDGRYYLAGDGHPSPEANRVLAEALVRDLKLASSANGPSVARAIVPAGTR